MIPEKMQKNPAADAHKKGFLRNDVHTAMKEKRVSLIKKALPAAFASALSQALRLDIHSIPLKNGELFKSVLDQKEAAKEKDNQQKKEGGQ